MRPSTIAGKAFRLRTISVRCAAAVAVTATAAAVTGGMHSAAADTTTTTTTLPTASTQAMAGQVNKQLTDEGIVMLENRPVAGTPALPLVQGTKVAVFGVGQNQWSATSTWFHGKSSNFTTFMSAMNSSTQLTPDKTLESWYATQKTDAAIPADVLSAAQTSDSTAVIVIHRQGGGEGADMTATKGVYYLTDGETAMISQVEHAFSKVVVVLQTPAMIDLSWLKTQAQEGLIQGAILVGDPGSLGGQSAVDVLDGAVDPSGHLTDTYAKSWDDYPSSPNWAVDTKVNGVPTTTYNEDIYVGYRYFETFAPDEVVYPFGYGLSYTTFGWSDVRSVAQGNGSGRVSVTVTNTGSTPGKDVVQVYNTYPKSATLDSAKYNLIGYAKTGLLAPGQSQRVTISYTGEDLAAYDESKACWELFAGDYTLSLGDSVEDIKATTTAHSPNTRCIQQLANEMVPQVPIKVLAGTAAGSTLHVTRNYNASSDLQNDAALGTGTPIDVNAYNANSKGYTYADVLSGKITLSQFVDDLTLSQLAALSSGVADRNLSPKLNGVSQLNLTSLTSHTLVGRGPGITSRDIYGLTMSDNELGVDWIDQPHPGLQTYPGGTVVAQTWNTDLIRQFGQALGTEMAEIGIDDVLGPAMDIHRNPLGGRSFEYFSEDPVVTGLSAAAEIQGVQSAGVTVAMKHFAANEQETDRTSVNEQISERALREIYLKGFEIAVKTAQPETIMTSYNQINGAFSAADYQMLTKVARDEWGFNGIFMSDWGGEKSADLSVLAGNNLAMGNMDDNTFAAYYADIVSGKMPLSYVKQNAMQVLRVEGTARYYHPATASALSQVSVRLSHAEQMIANIANYPHATPATIAALKQQIAAATDYLNFNDSEVLLHFGAYNDFRLQQLNTAIKNVES